MTPLDLPNIYPLHLIGLFAAKRTIFPEKYDNPDAEITFSGFKAKAVVEFRDPKTDIAILFADETVIKPSKLNEKPLSLSVGDPVYAIGAPRGLAMSISEGIVSAVRSIDGTRLIQTTCPISPGSSGGGLFTAKGELIGITTFKDTGGESLNFAVEASQVVRFFNAITVAKSLKITIDEKYLSVFDDNFIKWVALSPGNTGGTIADEFNEAMGKMLRNEINFENYTKIVDDINNRYYKIAMSGGKQGSQQNAANGSASKIVLVCNLVSDHSPPRIMSFNIDFVNQTINGTPSRITSDYIKVTQKNAEGKDYSFTFDRNAGTLQVGTEQFPNLAQGKCSKSAEKAF